MFLLFLLFIRHLPDINVTLEAMFQPKANSLPGHIQAVYVQNIAKLYAKILANEEEVCMKYDTHRKYCKTVRLSNMSHRWHTQSELNLDSVA